MWNRLLDEGSVFLDEPSSETIGEFLDSTNNFRGVQLHSPDKSKLVDWVSKFAVSIMSRLASRFLADDMKIMAALEVLNPKKMPADISKLNGYGDEAISILCKHYGTPQTIDGIVYPAYIDPRQLRLEWRAFKKTLHKYRGHIGSVEDIMEELLTGGNLLPHIEILYQVKTIIPYNTAMCERGFSRMKLIKDALRNRMYVETLNALMLIALVGPSYVELGGDGFFEEAIKIWESNVQRNPRKARFGNQNARKRRAHESKTELPIQADLGSDDENSFDLDQCADDDEDECADVADCDTYLVGSFKTPPGHLLQPPPEQVSNGLKGKKIAYKFEIEWEVGTFKCMYKGKNSKYKGHATVCFGRNCTMYLDLELSKYGMGADHTCPSLIKSGKRLLKNPCD